MEVSGQINGRPPHYPVPTAQEKNLLLSVV